MNGFTNGDAHAHEFHGVTSVDLGHAHEIAFFTYPVNGTAEDGHKHRFQGVTEREDGHFHRFDAYTGPAIPTTNGNHVHAIYVAMNDEPFEFKGGYYRTVLDIQRHTHRVLGQTGSPLGYEPPNW
jgi:hypothetical protein